MSFNDHYAWCYLLTADGAFAPQVQIGRRPRFTVNYAVTPHHDFPRFCTVTWRRSRRYLHRQRDHSIDHRPVYGGILYVESGALKFRGLRPAPSQRLRRINGYRQKSSRRTDLRSTFPGPARRRSHRRSASLRAAGSLSTGNFRPVLTLPAAENRIHYEDQHLRGNGGSERTPTLRCVGIYTIDGSG